MNFSISQRGGRSKLKGMREEEVSCRLLTNSKEKRPLTGDVTKCSTKHRLEKSTSCPVFIPYVLCLLKNTMDG